MSRLELAGIVAAIVLLGLAFQGGEYGTLDWLQLRRQLAEERAAVRAVEVELDSLGRAARALETDPVAQERAAREQFGMIRPGEILYRLVAQADPGSAPVRPCARDFCERSWFRLGFSRTAAMRRWVEQREHNMQIVGLR